MPLLFYTTSVSVSKTVGEIQRLLADAGAQAINVEYRDYQPAALTFRILLRLPEGGEYRPVAYRLPTATDKVFKKLAEDPDVPKRFKTEAQARRVAWRIIKSWLASQMALIESDLAELPQVFLPYALDEQSGRTLYEHFLVGNSFSQLESG